MNDYEPPPGTQKARIWERADRLTKALGGPPMLAEIFEGDGIATLRVTEVYYYTWLKARGLGKAARERRAAMQAAGLSVLPPSRRRGNLLTSLAVGRRGRRTRREVIADLAESDALRAAEGLDPIPSRERPDWDLRAVRAARRRPPLHPLPGAGIWRLVPLEECRP